MDLFKDLVRDVIDDVPEGRCEACVKWATARLEFVPNDYHPSGVLPARGDATCAECGFSPDTTRVEFEQWGAGGLHTRSRTRTVPQVSLPKLLEHQLAYFRAEHRFKVIAAGRRWGKTLSGLVCVLIGHGPDPGHFPGALEGKTVWWVTRNSETAGLIWRALREATRDVAVYKNEQERRIELPGGGSVSVKSAEGGGLRGEGLDGLVLDEAAYVDEVVWRADLRPALADQRGWAIFISTPFGANWFYDLYTYAEQAGTGDWYCQRAPTSENPMISEEELEAARIDTPPLEFRQEFLAEFVTDVGGIFKREWFRYFTFDHAAGVYHLLHPDGGSASYKDEDCWRFTTVDLAASVKESADYTVISTWAVTPHSDLLLIDHERFRAEGPDLVPALRETHQRLQPRTIWVERAGFQMTIIQEGLRAGLPIRDLVPDKGKVQRAMPAQARMAQGRVYFPKHARWLPTLEAELLRFSGKDTDRDDQVDTLAYAAIVLPQSKPRVFIIRNALK